MKYFFLVGVDNKRHIVIARHEDNARSLAERSGITVDYVYELTEDTFAEEGFLISDN